MPSHGRGGPWQPDWKESFAMSTITPDNAVTANDALAKVDGVTTADVLAIITDIRVLLARIEGYAQGMADASPAFRAGCSHGRRHARHGAR